MQDDLVHSHSCCAGWHPCRAERRQCRPNRLTAAACAASGTSATMRLSLNTEARRAQRTRRTANRNAENGAIGLVGSRSSFFSVLLCVAPCLRGGVGLITPRKDSSNAHLHDRFRRDGL